MSPRKLTANQKELLNRLDDLLFYEWDPIGISTEEDWPRDEYHSYLHVVFSKLINGCEVQEIASYLTASATENMGLVPSVGRDSEIAKKAKELLNSCSG